MCSLQPRMLVIILPSAGGQTVDKQMDLAKEHNLIDMFILISYLEVKMHWHTRGPYLGHFFILFDFLPLHVCERIMFWFMHLVHSVTEALINWRSQQVFRYPCFSPHSMFLASHVVIINVHIYQRDPHMIYKIMHIWPIKIKCQCIVKLTCMK